jgi:hypothetical protein
MKLWFYALILMATFLVAWSVSSVEDLMDRLQPKPTYYDAQGNACYRVEGLGYMCGSTDPRWYGGGLSTLYYIDPAGTVVKGL